jgi:hypothetical protein
MGYRSPLGWLRVPIAGFLAEVALIITVIPFFVVLGEEGAQGPLAYAVPPLCLLVLLPFGWWAARKAVSGHLLIGALVGLVAVALYVVPVVLGGREISLAYHLGDALKVIGGAAGGYLASRPGRAGGATAPG